MAVASWGTEGWLEASHGSGRMDATRIMRMGLDRP